jgi:hypothetical protein
MPFKLKHLRISNENRVKLINYLEFYVPLKNFSLIWRRHQCRWRAAKCRSMLGAHGLWAERDLYRATPAVTGDLGFSGLIRRAAPFSRLLRHTRGYGGSILTRIFTGYRVRKFKFAQPPDIHVKHNCSRDLRELGLVKILHLPIV